MSTQETGFYHGIELAQSLFKQGVPNAAFESLKKELNYISAELVSESRVRFPNVFARVEFLSRRFHLPNKVRSQLHELRRWQANEAPDEAQFRIFLSALAYLVQAATQQTPPPHIALADIPEVSFKAPEGKRIPKARVQISAFSSNQIECIAEDDPLLSFSLARKEHPHFDSSWEFFEEGQILSLIDLITQEDGSATARLIILMPDYLVDVSALAECFQRLSFQNIAAPALYFINRFKQRSTSEALFLGNLVNSWLDKLIHHRGEKEFKDYFKESFADFPLEYVTLFPSDESLLTFMKGKTFPQYANLHRVLEQDLEQMTPPVVPSKSLLEPSFISPDLGLQGRLDLLYLQSHKAVIIELKSGKVPWPPEELDAVGENHAAQARLYRMILQQVLGIPPSSSQVYVLYSSAMQHGSNLRFVARYAEFEQQMMDVRNQIVASEYQLSTAQDADAVIDLMRSWNYESCMIPENARIPGFFKEKFSTFASAINTLSQPLIKEYFTGFLQFVIREQWSARLGDGQQRKGHSALWNRTDLTENDAGSILAPLTLKSNQLNSSPPRMIFDAGALDQQSTDFRKGDIVVLYPYFGADSRATDRQVIKGFIADDINDQNEQTLGFRYPQQCLDYFDAIENWAIEHDYMDHTFQVMQRELFAFCTESSRKRDLLLGQETPGVSATQIAIDLLPADIPLDESRDELKEQVAKALNASDYYVLIGPPGTGKTSLFLRNLVANALKQGERLLLLSYTNRAVDEISKAVFDLCDEGSFLRIGSSVSCDPAFESSLLHRIADEANSRKSLTTSILNRKVVVSTVASILNRPEVFQLLKFSRIVVDEASQVLEPMLVNLLRKAPRFVLIGDEKQLPAVVTQPGETRVGADSALEEIGLSDFRNSLFERLLRLAQQKGWSHAWGQLSYQGRMHPSLMAIPNQRWYQGNLRSADRPHQMEGVLNIEPAELAHRLLFIDSGDSPINTSKVNKLEVQVSVWLIQQLLNAEVKQESIGVIAPYRAQVAAITQQLRALGITRVTVDTVERYQGSQRDHIIYSTTVNNWMQLRFLQSSRYQDGDELVDRKLNVAFTRSRKQFILIGNEGLLKTDEEYGALINAITENGGRISASALLLEEDQPETPF